MNKWRMILKRLNVMNVNSEYYVKRVNVLICLRFIHYKDVFKDYDLRFADVKNTHLTSIFDILHNGFYNIYVFFQ